LEEVASGGPIAQDGFALVHQIQHGQTPRKRWDFRPGGKRNLRGKSRAPQQTTIEPRTGRKVSLTGACREAPRMDALQWSQESEIGEQSVFEEYPEAAPFRVAVTPEQSGQRASDTISSNLRRNIEINGVSSPLTAEPQRSCDTWKSGSPERPGESL